MDILKSLRDNIMMVDLEIKSISGELKGTDDIRLKDKYRNMLSKFNNDKVKLLNEYHKVNQDITIRNRRDEMIIEKLRAEIEFLAKQGDAGKEIDDIMLYVNEAIKGLNSSE